MNRARPITPLLLVVGGVLLTNGWDHLARRRTMTKFKLELSDLEDRHHLTFDTYTDYKSKCAKLASFGLINDAGVAHGTR